MRSYKFLLVTSSVAAIMLLPGIAGAQTQDNSASAESSDGEAIVVTGSRIARDGSQAPTPVTVAAADDLSKVAPTSLVAGLAQLPQFSGSATTTSGRSIIPNLGSHGDFVNLHGIGAARTLVLQDGRRIAPTTYTGLVDTAIVPQLLVNRVEVVTAGASSAYGSDAVSGVVNFILDRKFVGLKGLLQGSITSRGDNESYRAGLAYGAELAEGLNLVASIERSQSWGYPFSNRPKYATFNARVGSVAGAGAPGSVTNPLYDGVNIGFATLGTTGGLITSGPFANQTFVQPGAYRAVNPGTPTGSAGFLVGGDYGRFEGLYQSLPTTNNTGFLRLNYEASDDLTAFVQVNATDSKFAYGQGRAVLLFAKPYYAENPFLPSAMATGLANAGVSSFTMQRLFGDQPDRNKGTEQTTLYYNAAAGLEGKLGNFRWDLTYQHSWSRVKSATVDVRNDRFAAATDAVRDSTGNIVCRTSLSADAAVRARYAGCVPLNMFGNGAGSAAALAYVTELARYQAVTKFDQIAANISGELFQLPAGPLGAAVGAEYRNSSLDLTSNGDPRNQLDNTGLRNLGAGSLTFATLNPSTARGSVNVKEVFGEVNLPVFADQPFARKLELNGAVRLTDYSTSGSVTTWKVGGVYEPIDGLRFRGTRSRDIRAPGLYDQFNNGTNLTNVFSDPHINRTIVVDRVQAGNRNLKPEVADTLSLGVVIRPEALPGFSFSVDYFDVNLKGAIGSINIDLAARTCEESNGTSPLCALIVRNPSLPFSDRTLANAATKIFDTPVNIAGLRTKGLDIELGYRTDLGKGSLSTRLFATYVSSFRIQDNATQAPVDYAGWTEGDLSSARTVVPKIRASLQVNYATDNWSLTVQERMVGRLKRGPVNKWAEADLPSVFYTDLTLAYKLGGADSGREIFLTANNLFDKDPPFIATGPSTGLQMATITEVYDTAGLSFTAGVRFKF